MESAKVATALLRIRGLRDLVAALLGMQGAKRTAPSADRNKEPIAACLARHPPFLGAAPALCLEVASGTGQHAAHLATTFPHVVFQPTEYAGGSAGPEAPAYGELGPVFDSITAWCDGLDNVRPPLPLDASEPTWTEAVEASSYDAIIASNVLHISPYAVSQGLFAGAGRLLRPGGGLFVYGPFRRGAHWLPPALACSCTRAPVRAPYICCAHTHVRRARCVAVQPTACATSLRVDGAHTASSNEAFDARLKAMNADWGVRDSTELARLASSYGLTLMERAALPANNCVLCFKRLDAE